MLNKEEQSALINMSMDAGTMGYCREIMDIILTLLQSKQPDTRQNIMQFLYCHQGAPLRLFFEIMRYLSSVTNEPVISYKL